MDYVGALQAEVQALGPDVVTSVGSYLTEDGPVSESGHAALLPVLMTETDEDALADDAKLLDEAVTSVDRPEGFETHVAGPATLFNQFNEIIEEDIAKGEGIGSIVALIVLLVVLGAVVAGLIPLVLAAFSIAIAMGATALAGQFVDFSFFVQNMITMIGLAVGIDYSLFIVARYREERLHGREKLEAIGRAGATANRAVFFSGMTVVLALLGLLIVPNTIFRSLAGGAIIVVLVAVAASMTLLPAILALLGDRINALRVRKNAGRVEAGTGFWDRVTRLVMRRPVISLVAGAGLMIVLAIPYFSIHTGTSGVSTLPDDIEGKRAFVLLEENFAGGLSEPAEIVIDGDIDCPRRAERDRRAHRDGGHRRRLRSREPARGERCRRSRGALDPVPRGHLRGRVGPGRSAISERSTSPMRSPARTRECWWVVRPRSTSTSSTSPTRTCRSSSRSCSVCRSSS